MKNRTLTPEIFKNIYKAAFGKKIRNLGVSKFNGGLKNRVYLIDDGKNKYVIKTIAADDDQIAPIDRNTLRWEADVLRELESLDIAIPRVIYYSDGIEEYPYPFLVLNYLSGNNYNECKDNLSSSQKNDISFSIGKINKEICAIKKDYYYLPSYPKKKFKNNYEFIGFMFMVLLKIYKKNDINIDGITGTEIEKIVKSKKKELNMATNICLCNIDLWDGNILVKNGEISGIVDFADTYYCDELMSFYFHSTDKDVDEYFLLGYDKKLKYEEKVRVEIYRLYTYLKIIIDCEIKKYGRFNKIYKGFIDTYNKLLTI